ncbi:hypothetical protein DFS34DRAFT_330318 [Phlyctochytrium arcticum]|nr:hypothetical protein DFS34DRAFT_330318 [Phlyctochytrium arcticum]
MADDAIIIPLQACQTEVPGLTPTIISPTDVVLAEMTELDTPKPQPLSLISADVHQDDTSHDPRNEQIHAPVTPARPTSLFPVPKVSPGMQYCSQFCCLQPLMFTYSLHHPTDQITAPLSATHDDDSYKPMEDADLGPSVTSLDDDMDGQEAANLTIAVLDDVVDDDPAADRSDSHSGDLLQSDNKPGGDVLPKTCSEESDVQSDIGDTAAYSSSPPKEGQEPKPPSSQKPNSPTKSTGVSDRDPISSGTSPGKKKKKRKGGGSMRGKDSSPQRL